ncbi:hypothetical protein MTO96_018306 [Rhipicephalus appendiculatus]
MRTEVFFESSDRDGVENEPDPPTDLAPRRPKCLLRFLLSRLYDRRYGQDLEWTDEEEGIFRIRWSCPSLDLSTGTSRATLSGERTSGPPPNVEQLQARIPFGCSLRLRRVAYFEDWSVKLKKWNEEDPKNLDKAKDRIRIALMHHKDVQKLNLDDQSYRLFKIENHQLLDDTKRRLRLKQQMRDGILSHVKYCYVHKTAYAPCCCQCSTWCAPPKPIFEDQQDGTYACEEFELFCTQEAPHVRCWYKMDDFGHVELTGGGAPIPASDLPGSI